MNNFSYNDYLQNLGLGNFGNLLQQQQQQIQHTHTYSPNDINFYSDYWLSRMVPVTFDTEQTITVVGKLDYEESDEEKWLRKRVREITDNWKG